MITIKQILEEVSFFMDISIEEIKGKSRKTEIVSARHLYFYSCYIYTQKGKKQNKRPSLQEISALVNRKHTTATHAINKNRTKDEKENFKYLNKMIRSKYSKKVKEVSVEDVFDAAEKILGKFIIKQVSNYYIC